MCGIAGSLRRESNGVPAIQSILDSQTRRGPDHQQLVEHPGERLIFGHNRLSILDLDARSNQPFADQKNLLVYNGEVYNFLELKAELTLKGHYFQTTSDTEVILKAYREWGLKAFEKFNGMFAFALYDAEKDQTVLVRDRYGVKPLYYHNDNGALTFASNAKALARTVSAKVNWDYLNLGLAYDLYEGITQDTAFQGVRSVPPGHVLIYKGGQTRLERFYDLRTRVDALREELRGLSEQHLTERLRDLLCSAVQLRLRSDVPVTLSLSGGLDSGLCAALMREVSGKEFEAFTFAQSDLKGSESALAAKTAKRLGIRLQYATIQAQKLNDIFWSTLDAQGLPFAHPMVMAQNRVFQFVHEGGYKVAIGGQGADEAFAGYRKFQLFYLKELMKTGQYKALTEQGMGVAQTLLREMSSPQRYLYYLLRFRKKDAGVFALNRGSTPVPPARNTAMLFERQILDVENFSLPTLLRYEDSNSMYYSIESRMPFLDYRVMEFGLALPSEMKVRNGFGKYLLRKVSEGLLPDEIVWARNKKAFSLDQSWWLKNGLGAELERTIRGHAAQLKPLLSADFEKLTQQSGTYTNPNHFSKLTTLAWLTKHQEFWS